MRRTLPATPTECLREEYDRRRQRNRRYSLRSFSRALGVPSGRMSEILNFKRPISLKLGERLAERLFENSVLRTEFLESVRRQQSGLRAFRKVSSQSDANATAYSELSVNEFSVIADWYHFAILSLVKTKDFQPNAAWIGRRLGISTPRAKQATARLFRLGLLEEKAGTWAPTKMSLTTTPQKNAEAIRRSHEQKLRRAIRALHDIPVDDRDISSMTMAIDRTKIPLAKQLLKTYRRQLCDLLEEGTPNEVYQLTLALVPMTKL